MSNLSDFLNLLSEAKKEVDTLENQQIEPLVEIVEKPKRKKINTSKLFENLKDTSFLDLLESEASKSKKISKLEEKKENEFFDLLSSIPISTHQVVEPIVEDVVEDVVVEPIVEDIIIEKELIQVVEDIQPIIEDVVVEPIVEVKSKDLTDGSNYDKLFKSNVDLFNQPKNPKVAPDIKALTDKIQYMENWLSKISMAGPGGGEVNLRYLDDIHRPSIYDGRYLRYNDILKKFEFAEVNPHDIVYTTNVITSPTYIINANDYYVGVNYSSSVNITLPTSPSSGRMLIIKDESGHANTNPITVVGTVDNDPGGFIIQLNNGAIQLIYRNGWRIV